MKWVYDLGPKKTRVAVELARKGISDAPELPASWLAMAGSLAQIGEFDEASACLRGGVERHPGCAALRSKLAWVLRDQGAFEEARVHSDAALALAPDDRDIRVSHFELLASMQAWEAAAKSLGAISGPLPTSRALATHAQSLDGESLLAFCEARLAENPPWTDAKYFKAIALAKLGRFEEARSAISLEQHVAIFELPAPSDYGDGDSFRRVLAEEILRNPTLGPDPRGKATRGGRQTRRLRQPDAVAVEALVRQIKSAVQDYEQGLAASDDEFWRGRPEMAHLNIWAVVYGKDGRQKAHRHSGGWLSGVYYVAASRPNGANSYRGPLILGALEPRELGVDPPWGTREVEPVPGRLVLFPSYVPHATAPSGVDGARISVAFDVVPVRP